MPVWAGVHTSCTGSVGGLWRRILRATGDIKPLEKCRMACCESDRTVIGVGLWESARAMAASSAVVAHEVEMVAVCVGTLMSGPVTARA